MFREGLAGLLASYGGMEVLGSTPNGEEAVALALREPPLPAGAHGPRDERLPDQERLDPALDRRDPRGTLRPEGRERGGGHAEGNARGGQEGIGGVLSARELEILLLAARGLSNREIGENLHIAEATLRCPLSNTYSKMEVSPRTDLRG
jgi:DNA-binding NarL/FixJ family response regulator